MINFFRKIRYQLLGEGKTGKYLKYAIGEILLVVIGILIALSINNWNTQRNIKIQETSILHEVKRNIESNLIEIEDDFRVISGQVSSFKLIIKEMNDDLPYHDSLSIHFKQINTNRYFNGVATGYELLKTKSAEINFQGDLLYELNFYFDESIGDLEEAFKSVHEHYYNYMLDYVRHYFIINSDVSSTSEINVTIRDYSKLKQDESFKTSLNLYNRSNIRLLNRLNITKKDSEEILRKVELYLRDEGSSH